MNNFTLVYKSFRHYLKANFLVAIGIAISAAVLTGGLIIGDSVSYSLEKTTILRLGNTTHSITTIDRYFRQELADDIAEELTAITAPLLLSEAVAISDGGVNRANRVQVVGFNNSLKAFSETDLFDNLGRNEIVISENLAARLSVSIGDNVLLRIKKESLIPLNAPFVSDTESSVSLRANIKAIAGPENFGRFSLKNSQTAPFNVFMPIERLNDLMEFEGKANTILISTEKENEEINQALQECWKPEDASLIFREIEKTGELEIISERIFLDQNIFDAYGAQSGAKGILTYFVNSFRNKGKETPYSFVSTLPDSVLSENEIIINKWLADDLQVNIGDSIKLDYYAIGPLRQLEEKTSDFIVKSIVGMDSRFADKTLMPFLPGLSDAGSCSEWEAGIPIDLEKIRDKDEDYWDEYRGTPKAFISLSKAQQIWSNRYGNYTSVRFQKNDFSLIDFNLILKKSITPGSIGILVADVKEKGMYAAQNGVDFSQLFIGLSFFLLIAAVLLTALLFLLNIENRISQIGTLSSIGFKAKQVKGIFLYEGIFISVVGSLAGLLLSVLYTKLIFKALNSLWYDIVRTDVLEIKITPITLLMGFSISLLIAVVVIYYAIHRKQKQQISDIQKKITKPVKRWVVFLKLVVASAFAVFALLITLGQFVLNDVQNPSYFFMSGGLMLVSLLLFADRFLSFFEKIKAKTISMTGLSFRNTIRNRNRSLSVLILFAIATFLVISTGANKQDLVSGSEEKSSGTGGFQFWAETTMPVLFDLNDEQKRGEEGLEEDFEVVQFRKVEGDDASCLNLNLISNPALIGVDVSGLEGRFSFATSTDDLNAENPWKSLEATLDDDVIPAIADQTVIQWGLGKKVGDTLFYQNELGDTLRLKLIGGLAPSVFQGYVIISNKYFFDNYPTNSGSKIFLIDGDPENSEAIASELQLIFRDFGWEQTTTAERLIGFYSVTNTYLSIFLALGALALVLGTIGLAIVLARSILERKQEIALLKAVGFSVSKIFRIITREYTFLLLTGVLIGFLTSVLATLPAFMSEHTGVSFRLVLIIVLIVIVNGLLWITALTWFSLKNKKIVASLKAD